MKARFVLLLVLLLSFTAHAQLTNGLVAHWNMNGNANDATGKGHNGTLFNVTPAAGINGQPNTAMAFNGVNSYISIPYQADMNVTDLSICALVRPQGFYTGVCQGNFIFSRGTHQTQGSYSLSFYDNCYNSCNDLDTNLHVFCLQVGGVNVPGSSWQSPHKVHSGNWYCVVATFNGTNMKLYVDGVLQATGPVTSSNLGTSTDEITIGQFLGGGAAYPYWYNGLIDDIRLYDRALTDAEVQLYCGELPPPDTGSNNPVDTSVSLVETTDIKICGDREFMLPYLTSTQFNAGNTFTAELSDLNGSFNSATVIGSLSSIIAGAIPCAIPAGTPAGNYKLRIRSSTPARMSASINLSYYPSVIAGYSFSPTKADTNKPTKFINTSVGATSYSWNFGDGTTSQETDPVHMFPATGSYKVCLKVENEGGCQDSVCRQVDAVIECAVGVPTAFSPNGDGNNDLLFVRGTCIREMHLRIYNRWGQVIFETTSTEVGWDGNYKDSIQDIDAVGYTLDAVYTDGTSYHKQGNITVIR